VEIIEAAAADVLREMLALSEVSIPVSTN